MLAEKQYTTQLQAGLGMVPECHALLRLHQPEISTAQLSNLALTEGIFPGCTARRVENLVREMFAPRFYKPNTLVADRLKQLIVSGIHADVINQLFLVHTARAQAVLHDFISQVYWPRRRDGADSLAIDDAQNFLEKAFKNGRMAKPWSTITMKRVSGYLLGACHDFDLLGKARRGVRPFLPFRIRAKTAVYLAHDLHFAGVGDNNLIHHSDWTLFGLQNPDEVIAILASTCSEGNWLIQSGGGLIQISWKNPTWKEAILAITR
jgi:hypothetical protein